MCLFCGSGLILVRTQESEQRYSVRSDTRNEIRTIDVQVRPNAIAGSFSTYLVPDVTVKVSTEHHGKYISSKLPR